MIENKEETPFDKAVVEHNSNPTEESMTAAHSAGFDAINNGDHEESYVTGALGNLKELSGIVPPFDVPNAALGALRDIAFLETEALNIDEQAAKLDEIISDAREVLGKGITLEPAHYSFIERRGTAEEAVLLTLSQEGFFFAGDVPMNDLSQRFIMLVNNNLTGFYDFHYDRGYNASIADGFIPVDLIELVKKLIPAAHRSNRNKDKVVVKEAKAYIEEIKKG